MKIKKILAVFALFFILVTIISCSDNEDTTPSFADKDRMETLIDRNIPQVVDFCQDYGTYLLYKFDKSLDFAYQFEQSSNWTNAALMTITHDDALKSVPFLYDKVFNCYSKDYKKNYFPRKILLVESLASNNELGLSKPEMGQHLAVANINSLTIAKMAADDVAEALADDGVLSKRCNQIHRAIIADYLLKARGVYPIDNEYLTISRSCYSALMHSGRRTAADLLAEDPDFFTSRGFFNPEDLESTYFPSAQDDVLAFITNMINMDKEQADAIMDMPQMADKMHLLIMGLQSLGVDVMKINPCTEQFLKKEHVILSTMFVNDVVTDTPQATLRLTITRGSHSLSHLVVNVNDCDLPSIDLTGYKTMRIVLPIEVDGLEIGANPVRITLYEQDREKAAAVVTTAVNYATMDNIENILIKNSNDKGEQSRNIKMSYGDDSVMYPNSQEKVERNDNLITICFNKVGWFDRYWEEHDCDYRAWKIYKNPETGIAHTIFEFTRGYNETMTDLVWTESKKYTLIYNTDGELVKVVLKEPASDEQTIVNDVVYQNGKIAGYTYCGRYYEPVYATANGVETRIDILDSQMKGQCFGFDGTESLNSYYLSCLPPVIPGEVAEIPLQLFYSRYIFNSIPGVWNAGWKTETSGSAMAKTTNVTIDNVKWTYQLKLN